VIQAIKLPAVNKDHMFNYAFKKPLSYSLRNEKQITVSGAYGNCMSM